MATEKNGNDSSYVYHMPSTSYEYPNKPYEPFGTNNSKKPLSKKQKRNLIVGIGAVILCLGLIISYQCIPSVKRFVLKNFLGTDKYYLYIETTNLNATINSLDDVSKKLHNTSSGNSSLAMSGLVDLTLDPTLLGGHSKETQYSLSFTHEPKKEQSKTSLSLSMGQKDLLDIDYLTNRQKHYLQFPELNSTYIDITDLLQLISNVPENLNTDEAPSSSSITSSYLNNQELLTSLLNTFDADMLMKLLDRYGNSVVEGVTRYSDLTLSENVTLDLTKYMDSSIQEQQPLRFTCDKFTVTLTKTDVITILQNLLELLKSDEDITQLVHAAGIDSFYFNTALIYIYDVLDSYKTNGTKPLISMEVYTTGNNIVFRSIEVGQDTPYQYTFSSCSQHKQNLFYLSLGPKGNKEKGLSLCISTREGRNGATGAGYASLNNKNFLISLTDLEEEPTYYGILPTGEITIQAEDTNQSSGWSKEIIAYRSKKRENRQEATLTMECADINYITLHLLFKPMESTGFLFPKDSEEIISIMNRDQMSEYLQKASFDGILASLHNNLSITMNKTKLMDSILSLLDDAIYQNIE